MLGPVASRRGDDDQRQEHPAALLAFPVDRDRRSPWSSWRLAFLAMANEFPAYAHQHRRRTTSPSSCAVAREPRSTAWCRATGTPRSKTAPGIARSARRQAARLARTLPDDRRHQALQPAPKPICLCAASARKVRRSARTSGSIEGRMFNPAHNELVVGKAILREFQGFELGQHGLLRRTAAGPWSASSRPTAACSIRKSGPTCRRCRACSTATTCSRRVRPRLDKPGRARCPSNAYVDEIRD